VLVPRVYTNLFIDHNPATIIHVSVYLSRAATGECLTVSLT